ncbi:hypothetical protein KR222_010914 [Zaprionus bogoriensis]|nr:hypothetical protein KR222_010914 [Zaprionus bogoriensis]
MSASYSICLLLLCLGCGLSSAAKVPPAGVGPVAPPADLAQDLMDIYSLIQFKPLNKLLIRYLINDAQFQAFVRILNSNEGFTARWRLLSQPEIVLFQQWVGQQLLTSGGKFEPEDMEMCVTLVNRYPYWSGTVYGWQGFLGELEMYVPLYAIRAQVQAKLQLQGIFAQFWTRLQALQVAYERWLTTPAAQNVINQLQTAGIDTIYLNTVVRDLLGWTATNGTSTTPTPALITPTVPAGAVLPPGGPLIL